jgi:hypothetical protein
VVHRYWRYQDITALHVAYGASARADIDAQPIYVWDDSHETVTTPDPVANMTVFSDMWDDKGDQLLPPGTAYAVSGDSTSQESGRAAIVVRNDGCTIYSGFLWDDFTSDENGDGVTDRVGLVANQMQYLLSAD